ncbi:MFS transporter [Anaerovorax odorimutans]|uniref:MFS transporter n=1 Tax=Anaerovorax odorimutans TaxID=109327 RepID=A0ABT1RK97_9FIRM|nr:MFS transporter [Anaerovorax odorimutans]MCQ4635605.1 MFS transporter [Anaerovorax odorimutans]
MFLILACGAFSGMMIISQASSIAMNLVGMNALSASVAVSILALFNTLGRLLAGIVSDKIGRARTLLIAAVLSIIGLLSLFFSHYENFFSFYFGISISGICFGSFMGVFPGFTTDHFGSKNNSVNYGIMFIGFASAGFFGPVIMNVTYTACGTYQVAFLIAMLLNIIVSVLIYVYRAIMARQY